MKPTPFAEALVALGFVALSIVPALGRAPDRLERFRAVATSRLGAAQMGDDVAAAEAFREIYELLDEEIVENLSSGPPFSGIEFLQDRLDAFTEVWGGATARVLRLGRLTIVAFQLSDASAGNSVRVYGRLPAARGASTEPIDTALLTTFSREGRPTVYALPAAPGSATHFLVAWEGSPSGRGTRPIRIDLVRERGDDVRVAWSTADVFPDGLVARRYSVRGAEIRMRYELRYPGWTPGCDGQTEAEDVYRLAPGANAFTRIARHEVNAWHREFRSSVSKLFAALAAGDRTALSGLVPDPGVRGRLPGSLAAEPACDATESGKAAADPERVSVAASAAEGPWQLTWHRSGTRWRLVSASPVIP